MGCDCHDCNDYYLVPNEHPTHFKNMPKDSDLDGYWWETVNLICIPLIESTRKGAFSEWLTKLEAKGKLIFIPGIINARLYERLLKRGYVPAGCEDEMLGFVDGLAWCPRLAPKEEAR